MPRQIDHAEASDLLAELFAGAEDDFRDGAGTEHPEEIVQATEKLFTSVTQAYRQELVGCAIARALDPQIDIRFPATKSSQNAFSGRSLDENVVARFLRERSIPISAAPPYLSALRGGAKFMKGGQPRIQRDQPSFDALVSLIDYLRELDVQATKVYLRFLLRRFIQLRESSKISLKRIAKPNLEQLRRLIEGLLTIRSGGRIPAFIATAMLQTLSECLQLGWEIDFQGINVADKISGAVGDITIRKDGAIILGVEITERPLDADRIKLVFDQKISTAGLDDYLFVFTVEPEIGATVTARNYTQVGHEINFVPLVPWLTNNLATIGARCRALFQSKLVDLLGAPGVPAEIKVGWNDHMDAAIGIKPTPA